MDGHEKFCIFCCRKYSLEQSPQSESSPAVPGGGDGDDNDKHKEIDQVMEIETVPILSTPASEGEGEPQQPLTESAPAMVIKEAVDLKKVCKELLEFPLEPVTSTASTTTTTTTTTGTGESPQEGETEPMSTETETESTPILINPEDEVRGEIRESLGLFVNISVCPDCMPFVTAAKSFKDKTQEVEGRVSKLQQELLQELKTLQAFTNEFYMEMKKIEEVILDSSINSLQNYIVDNSPQEERSRRGRGRGVYKLREKFLGVVQDLEFFQQQTSTKTDCLAAAVEEEIHHRGPRPVKVKQEPRSEAEEEFGDDFAGEMLPSPIEAGDHEHDPDEVMELEVVRVMPDVRMYYEDDDLDDEGDLLEYEDDEEDCDYIPSEDEEKGMENPLESVKGRLSKESQEKKRQKRREYKKRAAAKKRKVLKKKLKDATKGLKGFKRDLVARVRRRLERPSKKSKQVKKDPDGKDIFADDPRKCYTFDYDDARGVFTVGGLDIHINESEKFLECSVCSHKVYQEHQEKVRRAVEKVMAHHMFGKHLGAFQCHICLSVFQSFSRYRHHLRSHQNEFSCDICGKPMSCKDSVITHKWTHMNETEVAEAVASGQKDPRERMARAKLNALQKNTCRFCGKAFSSLTFLRNHEDTHLPPEERERIICQICGKSLTRSGYVSHTRYSCFAAESAPRAQCPFCPNHYKSKPLLQRHLARDHNGAEPGSAEERPHACGQCGKTFKGRSDLKKHEITHSDLRPFMCDKCGSSFKMKKHCSRHEKTCKGEATGNPRGRKIKSQPASASDILAEVVKQEPIEIIAATTTTSQPQIITIIPATAAQAASISAEGIPKLENILNQITQIY